MAKMAKEGKGRAGEGEGLEFKRSINEREIAETIVAMANSKGGRVLIGVDDRGRVVGISPGKGKVEKLLTYLKDTIKPFPPITVRELSMEGKRVLEVEVRESSQKPHLYKGSAYIREGPVNRRIEDRAELERLFLSPEKLFDSRINEEASLEDIDGQLVEAFHERAYRKGRIAEPFASVEETLTKLGLLKRGRPTNAAVLLFSRYPDRFFPQHSVKIGLFRRNEIVEMAQYSSPIVALVEEAYSKVMELLPKRVEIKGLEREEVPVLPEVVVREALVNALAHRNYLHPSSIYVKITEDKFEVENPAVPGVVDVEELYGPHPSRPTNPLIARTLYYGGYIEQWGTGTLRMIAALRERGMQPPIFQLKGDFFSISIPLTRGALKERQKEALRIAAEGGIKASQYARLFGVSVATAKRELDELVALGLLKKVGRYRSSRYVPL